MITLINFVPNAKRTVVLKASMYPGQWGYQDGCDLVTGLPYVTPVAATGVTGTERTVGTLGPIFKEFGLDEDIETYTSNVVMVSGTLVTFVVGPGTVIEDTYLKTRVGTTYSGTFTSASGGIKMYLSASGYPGMPLYGLSTATPVAVYEGSHGTETVIYRML